MIWYDTGNEGYKYSINSAVRVTEGARTGGRLKLTET